MVREDREILEKFVHERSPLGLRRCGPDCRHVELAKQAGDILKAIDHCIGLRPGLDHPCGLGFEGFDADGQSGLFLAKLLSGDLVFVVEPKESPSLVLERREALSRRWRRPGEPVAGLRPDAFQLTSYGLSEIIIPPEEFEPEHHGLVESPRRTRWLLAASATMLAAV